MDINGTQNAYPDTAVAVIGMSGRFPEAADITTFWNNLTAGHEALTDLTDEQLAAAGVPPELIADDRYVKKGSILKDTEMFDASFFGISAREAEITDPQHRLFLECCWEALEDAGCVGEEFKGAISVFGGAGYNSYLLRHISGSHLMRDPITQYSVMLGNDKDYLTTRVAYKLNLKGGCTTVQTACSTSLVAIQRAWQSLLSFESDIALAGGVSLAYEAESGYLYQEGMIFSPDGRCRPFDSSAQGTRFTPAAGVVALKRLEDAIRDRDHIRAVILGAAINNDGANKVGFSAPSIDGQAEVIALAQATAEVDPSTITYVEAHGTGTSLGDPIEIAALNQVFGEATSRRKFCAIGSVKGNIGHTDVAAGVTGFIKTVLCLENRQIPASINFETPNPQIDFENSAFYVNTTLRDWKTDGIPRRAGVSAFGIGGTNAHAVLEQAPLREVSFDPVPAQVLVFSAKSPNALSKAKTRLANYLEQHPDLSMKDVAFTLQRGRKVFEYREAVVCYNQDPEGDVNDVSTSNAIAALRNSRKPAPGSSPSTASGLSEPRVAFLFSGQGSQYPGMAREIYQTSAVFREVFDRCISYMPSSLGQQIRDAILVKDSPGASELLSQTAYTQPALFAVEYSLAHLLNTLGLSPAAMIGHSIGEYVAAAFAGVFSLQDAISLVIERGRLMQDMKPGSMIAVSLSEEELSERLTGAISIAALNTPNLCVVAGPANEISRFGDTLTAEGIACRPLHTSHAFHSSMMDAALDPFLEAVKKVALHEPIVPYISNVSGTWVREGEVTDPTYWTRHLRSTVRFSDGIAEVIKSGNIVFLETGPGTALTTLTKQIVAGTHSITISTLPHPLDDTRADLALLEAIGQLWVAGISIDWETMHGKDRPYKVSLPTYPFERKKYILPLRLENVSLSPVALASHGRADSYGDITGGGNDLTSDEGELYERPQISQEFVAPKTETELFLANAWRSLLGLETIGADDDFFELGGHSLLATSLMTRIRDEYGVRLPLRTIFDSPTVRSLASVITSSVSSQLSSVQEEGREEFEF